MGGVVGGRVSVTLGYGCEELEGGGSVGGYQPLRPMPAEASPIAVSGGTVGACG